MSIDPQSDAWIVNDKEARTMEYNGQHAVCLQGGYAYLRDVDFRDGVIECDLVSPVARSYLGIMFRVQSEENYELVYFQPHTSGKWDAVQYDPVFNGSTTWQLHHGPKYQAEAIVPTQEWFHVKIVVSGIKAEVYLDNAETATLVVRDLRHGLSEGSVGFWCHHPGNIANLTVTRLPSPKRARAPFGPPPELPYLSHWSVSKPVVSKAPDAGSLLEAAAKAPSAEWRTVASEESGIVNLNRHFKKPPGEATVFAKLSLVSDLEQVRRLHFGYSDKISVFLNHKLLYSGDNSFGVSKQPGARGYVRDDGFSVDLPLKKGRNDLLLAVSEKMFGWGFIARLDQTAGIQLRVADRVAELESFRADYEAEVQRRDLRAVLSRYVPSIRDGERERLKRILAGDFYYTDAEQRRDRTSFRLLMRVHSCSDGEATVALAHDFGYDWANGYMIFGGPDVYTLLRGADGQWRIAARLEQAEFYATEFIDINARLCPSRNEMAVTQTLTLRRTGGDGLLFFSAIKGTWDIESMTSPEGSLDFAKLASTVVVRFHKPPASKVVHLTARYHGPAGIRIVNKKFPKGVIQNGQWLEPDLAVVRYEELWHLQTGPAPSRLEVVAPAGLRIIADHGTLTETRGVEQDSTSWVWEDTEPSAGFGFLGSDQWNEYTRRSGELSYSLLLSPEHESEAETILNGVEGIVDFFTSLFGPCASGNFAVVDLDFGYCRPNFIPYFGRGVGKSEVHELAHHWWPGVFASQDSGGIYALFTDGFANYCAALYAEHTKGIQAYHRQISKYTRDVARHPKPDSYLPGQHYGYIIGPHVLHVLRYTMGDENFFRLLREFITESRGKSASLAGFRQMAKGFSGKDLDPLFTRWQAPKVSLPEYELLTVRPERLPNGQHRLEGRVGVVGEPYSVSVAIDVGLASGEHTSREISVDTGENTFTFALPEEAVSVDFDPSFACMAACQNSSALRAIDGPAR